MRRRNEGVKKDQKGPMEGRASYWSFCEKMAVRLRSRSKAIGVPFDLTAHDLDEMLVDTGWCCAVTGIPFVLPAQGENKSKRRPFAPSVDRLVAEKGYTRGNVRIVANIVNYAMNEWGEDAFWSLIRQTALNNYKNMLDRRHKVPELVQTIDRRRAA